MISDARQIPALAPWYPKLALKSKNLLESLAPSASQVVHPIAYGKMKGLRRLCNPEIDPAYYFLDGKHVRLIYLEDAGLMAQLTQDQMQQLLGQPSSKQCLPSSAAKTATHYVFAPDGIAYSVEDGEIVFVELFAPMTLADYLDLIYLKPGPWPL